MQSTVAHHSVVPRPAHGDEGGPPADHSGQRPGAGPHTATRRTVLRADIQALRALAVLLVLFYHLWPGRLTGGYIGVDVFFVISGYLITAHLLRTPPRSVPDLLSFWGRRIRRLLPASLLVLACTLVAWRLVAPNATWQSTASHVRAAALYVVNWRLASDSVDYLAQDEAATPVEHYWSLSIEEQFYLVWPVLIVAAVGMTAVLRSRLRWRVKQIHVVTAGLAALVVVSLAFSICLTAESPAAAYFVTPTRMWELGAGGLVAALLARRALDRQPRNSDAVPLSPRARAVLAWAGFAAILFAAFTFTSATPFPSWRAALPVLGTAAVIAAYIQPAARAGQHPVAQAGPQLIASRPVQWLGDVSYSVYLWHWPLIALAPFLTGGRVSNVHKLIVIAVTLLLAGATKRWVEDRFRAPRWGRPWWKPYLLGICLMTVVVAGAQLQLREAAGLAVIPSAAELQAESGGPTCFGAAAIAHGPEVCPPDAEAQPVLSPVAAKNDPSPGRAEGCMAYLGHWDRQVCHVGDGPLKVALVGNSHADQWLPAVEEIARRQHWSVTTLLVTRCVPSFTPQEFDEEGLAEKCADYSDWVLSQLRSGGYDVILAAAQVYQPAAGETFQTSKDPYMEGTVPYLRQLSALAPTTVVLRDTPYPKQGSVDVPKCLSEHAAQPEVCSGTEKDWGWYQFFAEAAEQVPGIDVVDMGRYFCTDGVCPAVIGGVPVYHDNSHLTATYSRTLAPYLEAALVRPLRQ